MKYIILGKNITVGDNLRRQIEKKLDKFSKYFTDDTEVHVTLKSEKDNQIIEVTVPVKNGGIIRAEESSPDMFASIDMVQETMLAQIRKHKNKLIEKHRSPSYTQEFLDEEADNEEDFNIVRKKKFGIKPMFVEDACLQMDLLDHNFYVFLNAETDEVNVVYKRKHGGYGLIEPELG